MSTISELFSQIEQKELVFPPCIRALYQKGIQGIRLTHLERLFIGRFFLNIGYTEMNVIDFYQNLPDFDQRIAKLQVDYLTGTLEQVIEGGSKKKQRSQIKKCDSLKFNHLCKGTNPILGHQWCTRMGSQEKPICSPMDFAEKMVRFLQNQ